MLNIEVHHASNLFYENILNSFDEGFVLQNQTGEIMFFNKATLQILGLSEDQLLGRTSLDPRWHCIKENGDPFPGDEHPAMVTLRTGKSTKGVVMGVHRPDNCFVWILINSIPFVGPDGEAQALTTFVNVTEQTQRNHEVTRLQQENNFIIASLKIGLWKWNVQENMLVWDNSMYDIFEIDKDSFTGAYEAWESALDEDEKEIAVRELQWALEGKKDFDTIFKIKTPRGKIKHIGGKGVVVRDINGKAQWMYGINWDRTHEVELEQALNQERLKAAQSAKLASLGEMSAGIAHEINNPLAIISGMFKLLPESLNDSEKLNSRLQAIDKSIHRISKIVQGLKKFSRSYEKSDKHPHELITLLEEALTICEIKAKNDNVDLRKNIESKCKAFCNDIEIEQVLINLINNGIDAASQSLQEKWVEVLIKDNAEFCIVQVADSGPGIPSGIQGKVFDPFFTTKEIGKGTGLGLSIAKGIVEDHGGSLNLISDQNPTCFEVRLKKA